MNYENFVAAVEDLALKYQRVNPNERISVKHTDCGLELTRTPKEQMRKQWVAQMLNEFNNSYGQDSEIILCDKKRKVLVAYFEYDWDEDERGYGIARCSSIDKFDKDVGLAVAFAHFREYPIPDFV